MYKQRNEVEKKKKIFVVLLAFVMVLSIVACGEKEVAEPELNEGDIEITGGWTESADGTLTDEVKAYFESATSELDGNTYEATKLIATQVVSGMNYKILCTVTPLNSESEAVEKVAIMYVDLEGNASITSFEDAE